VVRTLLVLGILLPLLGCGLGGGCEPPTDVILYSVSRYEIDPDYNPFEDFDMPRGYTEWGCDGPTRVWVLDDLDEDTTRRVLAHELWHVAGFDEHLGDPTCLAHGASPNITAPCPEELARMRTVNRTFHLLPEDHLWEATVWAAGFWNDALGTERFVVE
jgi:hypothetical protein